MQKLGICKGNLRGKSGSCTCPVQSIVFTGLEEISEVAKCVAPSVKVSYRKKRTLKPVLQGEWAVGAASFSVCREEESVLGG